MITDQCVEMYMQRSLTKKQLSAELPQPFTSCDPRYFLKYHTLSNYRQYRIARTLGPIDRRRDRNDVATKLSLVEYCHAT
jgi:hypothetical protein